MARWDVQPAGVQGVLAQIQGVASGFDEQMRAAGSALEETSSLTSSPIITRALTAFAVAQRSDVKFVFARMAAAMTGATSATQAYVQGDMEMAENADAQAAQAPDSGLPWRAP